MEHLMGCVGERVSTSCDIMSMFPHQLQPGLGLWTKRTAGFYVSNFCPFYFGGSRISHSLLLCCFVLLFCFICTITFLVLFLSGHVAKKKKKRKQISNNPVCKSVKTRRVLKRCCTEVPLAPVLFFCFFCFSTSSNKQHTSVHPSVVTYRQHSDWQQRKCYESMEWLKSWKNKWGSVWELLLLLLRLVCKKKSTE